MENYDSLKSKSSNHSNKDEELWFPTLSFFLPSFLVICLGFAVHKITLDMQIYLLFWLLFTQASNNPLPLQGLQAQNLTILIMLKKY